MRGVVKRFRVKLTLALAVAGAVAVGAVAVAVADEGGGVRETLTSHQEVPALSTPGTGQFRASIDLRDDEINYRLRFEDLESIILQAHLHFENATENGDIVVFLCTNLGNGPAGTQTCPQNARSGTISGTIVPANVLGNASARGLAAGEFDELVRAIRAGAIYVNVHSQTRPAGEIRGQLGGGGGSGDDDD
jgi:hypothetical protein